MRSSSLFVPEHPPPARTPPREPACLHREMPLKETKEASLEESVINTYSNITYPCGWLDAKGGNSRSAVYQFIKHLQLRGFRCI